MIGLQLYTLGDLFSQIGERALAMSSHQEAYSILRVSYGPESELAQGLAQLLRKK